MTKTCEVCGRSFSMAERGMSAYTGPGRFARRRYCSLECSYEGKRKAPPSEAGKVPCPLCGKLLVHGGMHFKGIHGMTAREVRKLTGRPTVDPVVARQMGEESRERWEDRRWWSDAEILAAIRNFYRQVGNAPSASGWKRASKTHPSNATVLNHFGSWNAALEAAGVPRRRRKKTKGTRESWRRAQAAAAAKRRNGETRACPSCGKDFYRPRSRLGEEACSLSCAMKLRHERDPTLARRLAAARG